MRKAINSMLVGLLMLACVTFFFTLSMVATGTATSLSNTLLFISAPVMVALLVWINHDCD